ncbi:MAG: Holliday junction branch migration DNA helicase RuvB, partial [Actinobacteria bacterium]|nr:Holliday junction branch migration DNA helicase RuvB [Actinomycetota bacterium]
GFIARSPRGRIATPNAWRHLGKVPPATLATIFDMPAEDA